MGSKLEDLFAKADYELIQLVLSAYPKSVDGHRKP